MSTAGQFLINVKVNEETSDFIQNALANSGIQFQLESIEPLRLRIPASVGILSIVTTILEEKMSLIEGQIILPSGQSYDINEEGVKA